MTKTDAKTAPCTQRQERTTGRSNVLTSACAALCVKSYSTSMAIGVRREFLLGRPSNECAEGRLDHKTEFVRLECHRGVDNVSCRLTGTSPPPQRHPVPSPSDLRLLRAMMGPRPSTSIITSELLTDGIVEKVSATSAIAKASTPHTRRFFEPVVFTSTS